MSALSHHQHKLPWAVFLRREENNIPYHNKGRITMQNTIMNNLPNELQQDYKLKMSRVEKNQNITKEQTVMEDKLLPPEYLWALHNWYSKLKKQA